MAISHRTKHADLEMADTVIVGAGIIGVSTAFYLSKHQPGGTIHLVDSSPELFASASGYAGGFLARDWFGTGVASLAALSFDEHKRLADLHDGASKWGYSRSTSLSYTAASQGPGRRSQRGEDWLSYGTSRSGPATGSAPDGLDAHDAHVLPPWLRREQGDTVKPLGDDKTTAQVDPLQLCRFLLKQCLDSGVHLSHPARATAIMKDARGQLCSLRIADSQTSTETDVPCTRLVIAAGAWSPQVFQQLFPKTQSQLPISSLAGHSLVLKSPRWTAEMERRGCHALYATSKTGFSPEIFSRIGGQLYVAGLNTDQIPLPELATEKPISADAIKQLKRVAARLLGPEGGAADDLEVLREGLCFRPSTPYGTPIISRIDDVHLEEGIATRPDAEGGVFLAAGHGPWGISLSLGTGKVLAEMTQGRRISSDVSSLMLW
ncbi:FAD dependent oxidoreductase [Diaporthe helianthi]|uniref:FAD dependent oxidoreductase n=1 Tax=Diaporthe helianthi TaxID=158607 RepID=A0A2P5I2K1_DIAHE|nr:FAD dependent oxidoreductase [Diaporthe helianthi]